MKEIITALYRVITAGIRCAWLKFWIWFSGMKRITGYGCPECARKYGDVAIERKGKILMNIPGRFCPICYKPILQVLVIETGRFGYLKIYKHPRPGLMLGRKRKSKRL
jgi:hypothetical protein